MKIRFLFLFYFSFGLFVFPVFSVLSAKPLEVVINEIAWMGTEEQWQNEWLELYNPGNSPVLLDGWTLKAEDSTPEVKLSGTIKAKEYFLLERTDDTTLPNIEADQIYKGGLNNQGEKLILLDSSGKVIDEVNCSLGWFAGSNELKRTMERLSPTQSGSDPDNWQTSAKKGGTPKAKNSEKPEIEPQAIKTTTNSQGNSNFLFILIFGIALSLFCSMLFLAFWLKRKKTKSIE